MQVSDLQGELESMSVQLQGPEVGEGEQNGTVTVDDLDQLQKINKDLEQQLGDKNKVCVYTCVCVQMDLSESSLKAHK